MLAFSLVCVSFVFGFWLHDNLTLGAGETGALIYSMFELIKTPVMLIQINEGRSFVGIFQSLETLSRTSE